MTNNIFHFKHDQAAIIEAFDEGDEERDRKECVALDQKVTGDERELAQWLLDHPIYTGPQVAKWLNCGKHRIHRLRAWAADGFVMPTYRSGTAGATRLRAALKTNDNLEDDTFEPSDDVEDPAQILSNILDSIRHAKAVAEAYRKIVKSSPFDRVAKKQIYDAINQLIVKWRIVQSTLEKKGQSNAQKKDN